MSAELAIAGGSCAALALGHATVGLRWVLPNLKKGCLPSTPLGPPSMNVLEGIHVRLDPKEAGG